MLANCYLVLIKCVGYVQEESLSHVRLMTATSNTLDGPLIISELLHKLPYLIQPICVTTAVHTKAEMSGLIKFKFSQMVLLGLIFSYTCSQHTEEDDPGLREGRGQWDLSHLRGMSPVSGQQTGFPGTARAAPGVVNSFPLLQIAADRAVTRAL